MKLIEGGNYDVYVYANDHPPPHCHVRHSNGAETVIGLPLLNRLIGPEIDKNTKNEILIHLEILIDTWERLNPDKHKK